MGTHHVLTLVLVYFITCYQTEGEESPCMLTIRVPRNTSWRFTKLSNGIINCSVNFCEQPSVRWCKVAQDNICNEINETDSLKTEWRLLTGTSGIFFLTFLSITVNDTGSYRCKATANNSVQSVISHSIAVSVNDITSSPPVTSNSSSTSTNEHDGYTDNGYIPIYICASSGLLCFIFLFILCRCIQRNKERSKSQKDVLHLQKIQIPDDPSQVNLSDMSHNRLPSVRKQTYELEVDKAYDVIYDNDSVLPTPRNHKKGSRKDRAKMKTVSEDASDVCGTNKTCIEDDNIPIIYAALKHNTEENNRRKCQSPVMEEFTEYAAIRV
ncbi:uncharacterized protein LOC120522898 [Polypterus senegalus]|uniref:uncharacterized protein LOC120522898 n=1 Tax=Polypterus senegalus TaxID=55291 RepID=UPI0019644391|nr:uncharacterized protein LOC120522898 [Polypterus senegalus]